MEAIKERGTQAYKEKRFGDAVKEFQKAIEAANTEQEKDSLHLLYSNMSAAYQQLGDFDNGATCAESCVQAKPTWAKGYSHLGLCKFSLHIYDEAVSAYKKAVELEPNKAEYKQALERAQRQQQAAIGQAQGGNSGVLIQVILILCWMAMFGFGILYLVNLTASPAWLTHKNKMFVYCFAAASLLSFWRNHGVPKFNRDFGLKVMMDKSVQRLLGGFLLLVSPNFLIMAALMLSEFTNCISTVVQVSRKLKMFSVANAISSRFMDVLLDRAGNPYFKVNQYVAHLEVAALGIMVLSIFTPRRNLIALLLYCQYLQLRFVIENILGQNSGVLHVTFSLVDKRITNILSKFPSFVGSGYSLLKGFLQKQVKLPDPNDAASSKSRCSIM